MRVILLISLSALVGCAAVRPTYTANAPGVVAELRQGEATHDQAQVALGNCISRTESPSHEVTAKWAFRESDSAYTFVDLTFGPDGKLEHKSVYTAGYGWP